MARTPRATVSKTSGQGISRLAYQQGRRLGGNIGAVKGVSIDGGAPTKGPGSTGGSRDYAKGDRKEAGGMNISYGATLMPSDIKDVEALGERPLPRTKALGRAKTKQLK